MNFVIRKATIADQPQIEQLIAQSVRELSRADYTEREIELSINSVFGVDTDLIRDNTYFVAIAGNEIIGCGGWSKRKTLYGASDYASSRDTRELDPEKEAAKIRAFFIAPHWARKGVGTAILAACESEAKSCGFQNAEMMATLPGVKLYEVRGYQGDERVNIEIGEDEKIVCVKMEKRLE
jgi:N-acetylglutamate synthase-like GNAT family acetyltransferase